MLKEEKKNISAENNDDKESQSESEQEVDEVLQQPQLKDNSFSQIRIRRKKRQNIQGGKSLFDIFYELITLVNKHHHQEDKNNAVEQPNENNHQLFVSNRLLNKKKNNKIIRSQFQDLRGSRDLEKTKQNSNKKQPILASKQINEASKKNVSFNQPSNNRNFFGAFQEDNKKKQIFDNYPVIMNYRINFSEDESDIYNNLKVARPIRFKNPEPSLSEYSFAHSSKNVEQKQKRKFSVEKTIEIKIVKAPALMQIIPQYQITQSQCLSACFNTRENNQN